MEKTIRLRKGIRKTGIVCLLLFLSIGVASVSSVLLSPPPNAPVDPIFLALGFAIFWGAWASAAMWSLLSYWRGQIIVTDEQVIQRGVLNTKIAGFNKIERVVWKTAPPQINLHTQSSRLKIALLDFAAEDRLWLVRLSRGLSQVTHEGWDMFCVRVAVPLERKDRQKDQPVDPGKVSLTRRRWAYYFFPTSLVFAVVGVVLSLALQRPQLLAAPLPIVFLWAFMHFGTPRKGLSASRIRAESDTTSYLRFLLVWCVIAVVGSFLFAEWNLPKPEKVAVGIGGGVLWFAVLVYKAIQLDRKRQQEDEGRVAAALNEWSGDVATQAPSK